MVVVSLYEPVVFRHLDHSREAEELKDFRSAWLSMLFRHPLAYLQATLGVIIGFFYNNNEPLEKLEPHWVIAPFAITPEYTFWHNDRFEKAYYNHLKSMPEVVKNITFITKAEDKCLSVACSSIISRYIFLKEIKKLSEKYNTIIPLGASEEVDKVAAQIAKKHGKDILKEIVKLSFKNTEKVEKLLKEKD